MAIFLRYYAFVLNDILWGRNYLYQGIVSIKEKIWKSDTRLDAKKFLKKIVPNISYQRRDKRQDSKIEVWCISSFDNVQEWFQSKIMFISRIIHCLVRKNNVSKDGYDQDSESSTKHYYGDVKSSSHTSKL